MARRTSPSSRSADAGYLPPHDIELERALLGAMLLERNVYFDVAGLISSDTFYDDRHALIFTAIRALAENSTPVDLLTVGQQLQRQRKLNTVGGPSYLAELTQTVGSAAHAGYHAKILYQMAVLRAMISECNTLAGKCYAGDFDDAVAEYGTMTSRIDMLFAGSGTERHIRTILKEHGEVMDRRLAQANLGKMPGLTYGLSGLDELTGGMQPGQLIIVAARPAMGKTAVALHLSKSPAERQGASVMIASLEMTGISLTDRLLASYAGIDGNRLRSGRMGRDDWQAYEQARGELGKLNIYIDDTAGTTLSRLRAVARTKRRKGELDLLVIDYLQLIESESTTGNYRNREREVAEISRGLKKLAKELNIPVVLLCQLNRQAENRADKQPQLYDLRESGAIEQDADVVLMPFRPAYYPELVVSEYEGGPELPKDVGMIFVRKQRDGKLGTAAFRYSADLSKLTDYHPDVPAEGQQLPF